MIKFLSFLAAALLAPYVIGVAYVIIMQPSLQHTMNALFVVAPLVAMVLCAIVFAIDEVNG